jgi:hypothetical protein
LRSSGRSGGDFLVEAEMLFDCGDADFKLKSFVDFVLAEIGRLEPDPLGIDVDDVADAALISEVLHAEPAALGDGAE